MFSLEMSARILWNYGFAEITLLRTFLRAITINPKQSGDATDSPVSCTLCLF